MKRARGSCSRVALSDARGPRKSVWDKGLGALASAARVVSIMRPPATGPAPKTIGKDEECGKHGQTVVPDGRRRRPRGKHARGTRHRAVDAGAEMALHIELPEEPRHALRQRPAPRRERR